MQDLIAQYQRHVKAEHEQQQLFQQYLATVSESLPGELIAAVERWCC